MRKGVLATAPEAAVGGRPARGALHDRHAREEHRRAAGLADELRAAGWDIRVKPGATHEIHVQDPAGLLALLADLFEPVRSSPQES